MAAWLMVTFENTEGYKLPLSVHFGNRHNGCINLACMEKSVFYLTELNPESIELDLIIFTAEAPETKIVSHYSRW